MPALSGQASSQSQRIALLVRSKGKILLYILVRDVCFVHFQSVMSLYQDRFEVRCHVYGSVHREASFTGFEFHPSTGDRNCSGIPNVNWNRERVEQWGNTHTMRMGNCALAISEQSHTKPLYLILPYLMSSCLIYSCLISLFFGSLDKIPVEDLLEDRVSVTFTSRLSSTSLWRLSSVLQVLQMHGAIAVGEWVASWAKARKLLPVLENGFLKATNLSPECWTW